MHPQTPTHTLAKTSDAVSSPEGDARGSAPDSRPPLPQRAPSHLELQLGPRLGPRPGQGASWLAVGTAGEGAWEWPQCWGLGDREEVPGLNQGRGGLERGFSKFWSPP